jgi:hypothetical protein
MEQQNRLTNPELEDQVRELQGQVTSLTELVANLMIDVQAMQSHGEQESK